MIGNLGWYTCQIYICYDITEFKGISHSNIQSIPQPLTHKQLETHECILITLATNALVLMHQVIHTHSAD